MNRYQYAGGPAISRQSAIHSVCEALRLGVERKKKWSYNRSHVIRAARRTEGETLDPNGNLVPTVTTRNPWGLL